MPTHYEVLGVPPDADAETIRAAYVALAKANHPDRRRGDDPDRRARAEARMRQANQAWHVLRDPARRRDYDLGLPGPGGARPSSGTRPTTGRRPATAGVGSRPAPPSGVVVPASHAGAWRWGPVVVLVVVLLGVLVISAYATSGGDAPAPGSTESVAVPEVDDCVLVAVLASGRVPVPVACGTAGASRVVALVDTPRPCPPSTQQLPLSDNKTTLCLGVVP